MSSKPKLRIFVTPDKVQKGQMLAIQAFIFDSHTNEPLPYKKIYMQILDEKGIEVWPLSTMAENTDSMEKLISTAQLEGGRYQVRVSPSRNLSPMAYTFFEIEKTFDVVPLIPLVLLGIPTSSKHKKIESDFVAPRPRVYVEFMTFETELDSKVCPICLNFAGRTYRANESIPIIGPPELGGETHWGCRCKFGIQTNFKRKQEMQAQLENIYDVYQAAKIATQYFNESKEVIV